MATVPVNAKADVQDFDKYLRRPLDLAKIGDVATVLNDTKEDVQAFGKYQRTPLYLARKVLWQQF